MNFLKGLIYFLVDAPDACGNQGNCNGKYCDPEGSISSANNSLGHCVCKCKPNYSGVWCQNFLPPAPTCKNHNIANL